MADFSSTTVAAQQVAQSGMFFSAFAAVGNSETPELRATITNLQITDPRVAIILLQPRDNSSFSDAFTTRIIEVGTDHIVVSIGRVDSQAGWALQLRLDILIVLASLS